MSVGCIDFINRSVIATKFVVHYQLRELVLVPRILGLIGLNRIGKLKCAEKYFGVGMRQWA